MTDRPPAKLWRVYGPRSFSTDHSDVSLHLLAPHLPVRA